MLGKETFIHKKILIYGLGISGKSCLKFLFKKNNVIVFDDNSTLKNIQNKSFFLSKEKISKINFDFIVISPGIDLKKCKLKNFLLKNKKKNYY